MTRISLRTRLATVALGLTAAGAAVAGTIAGLGVPASAAPSRAPAGPSIGTAVSIDPDFLSAGQLPRGKRYGSWDASRIYDGVPRRATFCLADALPAADTRFVSYAGKRGVAAEQYVTALANPARAKDLVADLRRQIQGCYREWLALDIRQYQEGQRKASWKRYGTRDIEDGLTVYGVFTVPPERFARTTHLYAVGRDGDAVMVLHLAVTGSRGDAPKGKFTKVGAKALRQLF